MRARRLWKMVSVLLVVLALFAQPARATDNYQGLWWNPAESGWGINFAHQGDTVFATWFTYDAKGKPAWLIAVLDKKSTGSYSGNVLSVTGPPFDTLPWDTAQVAEKGVGTMTVTFSDVSHGSLAYTVNGVTQTKAIVPQDFGGPARCTWNAGVPLARATNYTDLWWNADESGWGVNFTHQGDTVFATWFTYDGAGKPWWLVATLARNAEGIFTGEVATVEGPAFGAAWDATKVRETVVGSAQAIFADGNTARFAYTVNGVSQAKTLTRQVFVAPGTVCVAAGAPGVAVSLTAPRVLLQPGETRDLYVQVTPHDGYTGAVALAATGLPAGVTATLEPANVTVSGASTVSTRLRLTVAGSAATTASPVAVTIAGTAGSAQGGQATLAVGIATTGDPVAVRLAAIAAVEQHARDLGASTADTTAFLQGIAAFMASRSEYKQAGVDAETQTAWGIFADGTAHAVAANRLPAPRSSLAPAGRAPPSARAAGSLPAALVPKAAADLPQAVTARLLHSFGAGFEGQDPIVQMTGYLQGAGWKVRPWPEGEAGVDTLRAVRADGFFYINTHGGRVRVEDPSMPDSMMYAIQSSTPVNDEWQRVYADDLAKLRLVHFTARNGESITILGIRVMDDWDTRYAITYRFVDAYMSFAAGSVVLINACYSSRNADFVNAFLRKNAGVYLGWSEILSSATAYESPPYFVDRMLGANQHPIKESPPQRPFPYDVVLQDMAKKGLATDKVTGGKLQATPRTGLAHPPIFAPSIQHAAVDEWEETLTLKGEFGTTAGKVTVGGTELALVKTWAADELVARLPGSGAGSYGDVLVTVRDVRSNARQLSRWAVPLTHTWVNAYDNPGLRFDGTGTVRFRADLGGYRTTPGEAPKYTVRGGSPTKDSSMTVVGSGSYNDGSCTETLSGTGTFVSPAKLQGVPGTVLASAFSMDGDRKLGALGLAFGFMESPFKITLSGRDCSGSFPAAPALWLLDGPMDFPADQSESPPMLPLPGIAFPLTSSYGIPGTARTYRELGGTITISWTVGGAQNPPRNTADAGK